MEGKRWWVFPGLAGITGSLIAALLLYFLPIHYLQDYVAIFLGSVAALFVGIALNERKFWIFIMELLFFVVIFLIAGAAMYYSVLIAAAGFIFLGVWSLLHLHQKIGVPVAKSPALGIGVFCLASAGFILLI